MPNRDGEGAGLDDTDQVSVNLKEEQFDEPGGTIRKILGKNLSKPTSVRHIAASKTISNSSLLLYVVDSIASVVSIELGLCSESISPKMERMQYKHQVITCLEYCNR